MSLLTETLLLVGALVAVLLVVRLLLWALGALAVWRRFKAWLRRNIVVQVLAVEPGDVLVVNFTGPGVGPAELAAAQESIARVLQAVHAEPGRRGRVQVIVGKGIDVNVVRQVYGGQPAAAGRAR